MNRKNSPPITPEMAAGGRPPVDEADRRVKTTLHLAPSLAQIVRNTPRAEIETIPLAAFRPQVEGKG
jgi:hypothetical protein